jgi:disulfide bond formation protein DsbB
MALCGAVLAAGAAVAAYHVGVEQHWVAAPAACTGIASGAAAGSVEELKRRIMEQQVVRCDEIAWSLFGISMAGRNFLASVVLAASTSFLRPFKSPPARLCRGPMPRDGPATTAYPKNGRCVWPL